MIRFVSAIYALPIAMLVMTPAHARDKQDPDKKPVPVTDQKVDAGDVALTPLSDLNIKKTGIPPLLIAAQDRPYSIDGMRTCAQLNAAVTDLNTLLGEDIDVADDGEGGPDAGRVAQSVVGSLIPFRGLIRELSGANSQERKLQSAIIAGSTRRGFLKGIAQQRGCKGIARPATNGLVAAADPAKTKSAAAGTAMTQKPVVQETK
ncbi:hypothetical protein [Novosphingobium sp.]|uniref:hypothetical protein n=1 Tax=Novosphingobium sp. TaxID=1874826 RepID=UPI0025E0DD71|nr:hypothetical protein [Novosphingobium sp.]